MPAAPPKPPVAPPGVLPDDLRVHDRHAKKLRVFFTHEGNEDSGITRNLSLGGMYIVTTEPPPFGAQVWLRFRLPTLKEETRVKAQIRWIDNEGMGLQFGTLRAIEVWALNQYLKEM